MRQIEVTILGQSYRLMCPEDGEASLRKAVASVDQEMSGIRDAGKVRARERIAVLAALNLAYRLAERGPMVSNGSSPSLPSGEPAGPDDSHAAIDRLVHRLDAVLRNDGHLL